MIAELVSGAVALLLYVNTLNADFCYDDSRAIKENRDLLPETHWTSILYDDFWGMPLTHSGSHKSFRPLCSFSFRLNYALGGLEPQGYHLVNVVLHCCVTVLFTTFCGFLMDRNPWRFLAGLLFAAHPVHTEAVAGLVGRADIGAALCLLFSLLCYSSHCKHRPSTGNWYARWGAWAWLAGCLVGAAAAMLWKEQGVTVLAVSAVYDICVVHRMHLHQVLTLFLKRRSVSLLVSLACLTGCGMALLGARLYWMGSKMPQFSSSDNPAANSPHLLTRTLTFLYLPVANAWLLICPYTLSFDWSMDAIPLVTALFDYRNFYSFVFYLAFLLLAWFGLRSKKSTTFQNKYGKSCITNYKTNHHIPLCLNNNNRKNNNRKDNNHLFNGVTSSECPKNSQEGFAKPFQPSKYTSKPSTENLLVFSLGLLSLPFLPATNLFFYVGFVVAERVLYIPSMGFCLLVTLGIRSLFLCIKKSLRALVLCCVVSLLLLYSLRTVYRNEDWQSEENLFKSGISINPAKAWGNLGNVLKNQGKMSEAEEAYRNALFYRGNMADVLYNLGLLLQESQRFSEALHYYSLAIRSRPTLASAYLNTGIILMSKGNLEDAKHAFQTCASIPDGNLKDPHAHKSSVTSCLYNLGNLLHEQGQQEEALSNYKQAVKMMPHQFKPQSLYNMMGEAYVRLSKLEEAEHWYKESLKAKPDHVPAHLTYAKLLSIMGQITEAEHYFLKAVELVPNNGNCYIHYGQFLLEQSRLKEAAMMVKKAVKLESTEFDIVFNAAHILRQASLNEAAERYYQKAANLKPKHAVALMNLGAILHLNGKLEEAEANYLHALQLRPDDLITKSNLHKLWNVMQKQGLQRSDS